jgi:hypothetical protein
VLDHARADGIAEGGEDGARHGVLDQRHSGCHCVANRKPFAAGIETASIWPSGAPASTRKAVGDAIDALGVQRVHLEEASGVTSRADRPLRPSPRERAIHLLKRGVLVFAVIACGPRLRARAGSDVPPNATFSSWKPRQRQSEGTPAAIAALSSGIVVASRFSSCITPSRGAGPP